MTVREIFGDLFKILVELIHWGFNISAFILLPLIIYAIIYIILHKSVVDFLKLPEAMFISIVLIGDTLSKTILFNIKISDSNVRNRIAEVDWEGPERTSQMMISAAILGITISTVLLTISIISEYKEFDMQMQNIFYELQYIVFLASILGSVSFELIIRHLSKRYLS